MAAAINAEITPRQEKTQADAGLAQGQMPVSTVRRALHLAWASLVKGEPEDVRELARLAEAGADHKRLAGLDGALSAAGWSHAEMTQVRRELLALNYLLLHTEHNLHLLQRIASVHMGQSNHSDTKTLPYGGLRKWQHSIPPGKSLTPPCALTSQR